MFLLTLSLSTSVVIVLSIPGPSWRLSNFLRTTVENKNFKMTVATSFVESHQPSRALELQNPCFVTMCCAVMSVVVEVLWLRQTRMRFVVIRWTYDAKMAFAAARMIMPKDKQARKASAEMPGMNKNRSKVRFFLDFCFVTTVKPMYNHHLKKVAIVDRLTLFRGI